MGKSRIFTAKAQRNVGQMHFVEDVRQSPRLIASGALSIADGQFGRDALAQARRLVKLNDPEVSLAALVGNLKYNVPYYEARRAANGLPPSARQNLVVAMRPVFDRIVAESNVQFGPPEHQHGKWRQVEWDEFYRERNRAPAVRRGIRIFTPEGMERAGRAGVFKAKPGRVGGTRR